MSDHGDYEAFLHIVHVSDMHFCDPGAGTDWATDLKVRAIAARLRIVAPDLAHFVEEYWEQGKAGHDPRAVRAFAEFLQVFAADPEFGGIETWLLDTGDLSSLGDVTAIQRAKALLAQFQTILGASRTLVLRGNHDSWPGRFPAVASTAELAAQATALQTLFPFKLPQAPICRGIPGTSSQVQLYAITSVIHDRLFNTFALGGVGDPRHWAGEGESSSQLAELASLAMAHSNPVGEDRHLRLLAIHHPVHYPPPEPRLWMRLKGAKAVAKALITFDSKRLGRLAHLVLSGHTHRPFPKPGKLPDPAASVTYKPLAAGQLQLVAGSLCQTVRQSDRDGSSAAEFVPHQCQILTFWKSPKDTNAVLVERRIAGRIAGVGKFGFLELGDPPAAVESTLLEF